MKIQYTVTETETPTFRSEADSMGTVQQAWDCVDKATPSETDCSILKVRLSNRTIVMRETADDWDELVSLEAALKDPFDLENLGTTQSL